MLLSETVQLIKGGTKFVTKMISIFGLFRFAQMNQRGNKKERLSWQAVDDTFTIKFNTKTFRYYK